MQADSPASTASWQTLGHLRRRGQRPQGGVWIVDETYQRQHLEDSGAFAVGFPEPAEVYLVAGLGVTLIADKTVKAIEIAHMLAMARPAMFVVLWREEGRQLVIEAPEA